MRVQVIGGGPAGLYAALLLKKNHPAWEIDVAERNSAGATYGWGVVFSDRTLSGLREADYATYTNITDSFVLWEAIDVHTHGTLVRCAGHAFAGIGRRHLLRILQERCAELGVRLRFETEIDPSELIGADLVIAADGVNSRTRALHEPVFGPSAVQGRSRYIWFGTDKVYDSFTFVFNDSTDGLFQVHAYPFDATTSTFIVECAEDVWRRAGLDQADEATSVAFCEALFAEHLGPHRLLSNRSLWMTFVTLKTRRWSHGNTVLLGDAAHTAHFSIGSGTKLALEDAIALAQAFEETDDVRAALRAYELGRRPRVEGTQRAAAESQRYFEDVARYRHFAPQQFVFHLLTRSGRITYDNLRQRDPFFVDKTDRWFRSANTGETPALLAPAPIFTPQRLRDVTLPNRLVSDPAPTYAASAGAVDERYVAHLQRAVTSGAGLVLAGPVAISPDARITPGDAGIYSSEQEDLWRRVIEELRNAGAAHIGITLSHAGRRGATRERQHGLDRPLRDGAWPLIAPSALAWSRENQIPRAMDAADMQCVRDRFVEATQRASAAGFDLVQLHMAHGYLLASFLSPLTNMRDDDNGGTLDNRMRFPLEVFDAVRAAWPHSKPLAVALSASDWARGGYDLSEAVRIAHALRERGCDLITVLAGQTVPNERPDYSFDTLAHYADVIRNEARIATIATAYMVTSDPANTLLAGGRCDLCVVRDRGGSSTPTPEHATAAGR
jgi:anthraniloyl-CoA monooxygenase